MRIRKNSKQLSSYLYADEVQHVKDMLRVLDWDANRADRVAGMAVSLVRAVRKAKKPPLQLERFLQDYALDTDEGLALMTLAEALLRIPDKATMSALIRDKMGTADWLGHMGSSKDWVAKAAGLGLVMTSRTLDGALSRIGEPFIREAMVKAMHLVGTQFVLGQDIADAVKNAQLYEERGARMSFDMLGEGARTAKDAERYFQAYMGALDYIAAHYNTPDNMPGISVKLSALHPRYEFAKKEQCIPALVKKLHALCVKAAAHNIALTVDAEEVERLDISLAIIEDVISGDDLAGWDKFGLAVQAYQKRAIVLIDQLAHLAKIYDRKIQVRLVKGAYWDREIKRAQELGVSGYPVFTRKCHTDTSYLVCAQRLLEYSDVIYPMFGTHNAHTMAAIVTIAYDVECGLNRFEFQRLHGMGEGLYAALHEQHPDMRLSIYAPVGTHEHLLAYLVRRLLENGANSSFVNKLLDKRFAAHELVADPVERAQANGNPYAHPRIIPPADIYLKEEPYGRVNSKGIDLDDGNSVVDLLQEMARFIQPYDVTPVIGGKTYKETAAQELTNPADQQDNLGLYWPATEAMANKAMRVAGEGYQEWRYSSAEMRAQALEDYARLLEKNHAEMMALLVREAGKTIPDALAEIREAVDFCRYYANQGRKLFKRRGHVMPSVTGERNVLNLRGRGVFICISPWNFPLAIFTGQIAAALMAGNAVIAKPAEQTPLIAHRAVALMHAAGIPKGVLQFMPGEGETVGAALVAHKDVAGVVFTGSTEVARMINRTLAEKDGEIVPLIAETGGMNAMFVDSSALPEQVVDDVILSAFGSAGQRCSALRILCVQDDVADTIIEMLAGAMQVLKIGAGGDLTSDLCAVIDEEARGALVKHRENLKGFAKMIAEVPLDEKLKARGHFFAPVAFELPDLRGLEREVFGPILHVVRYKRDELGDLIAELNDKGYGLTLGVHSRIDSFAAYVTRHVRSGNAYVNRSMTGAIVGSQPFGGQGLSGTGPKAGGPHYLPRFATEEHICIDTTASGGNTALVSLED